MKEKTQNKDREREREMKAKTQNKDREREK